MSNKSAELYIVRLTRKAINEVEIMPADADGTLLFSTDYFDEMRVKRVDLKCPFSALMGIGLSEDDDCSHVAMQSYSLYSDKDMQSIEEKLHARCGCPFEFPDQTDQASFVSMIQVHITPEAVAHGEIDRNAKEFLTEIFKDLLVCVDSYAQRCAEDGFSYRIYKMLSAGDFAVVTRSPLAETSFHISSLLRRRMLDASAHQPKTGEQTQIVLYKTYTLLTLDSQVMHLEKDVPSTDGNNQFVLRCCFSNLYWSSKDHIDCETEHWPVKQLIYGLNGRYDFSFYITQNQFLTLYPYIETYKKTGKIEGSADSSKKTDDIVSYMLYMMSNQYLSYINERYLIDPENRDRSPDKAGVPKSTIKLNVPIQMHEVKNGFLEEMINCKYRETAKKYHCLRNKMGKVFFCHKDLSYHIDLLGKLLRLCGGINSFSDTRLYAIILLEQMDVVIDSLKRYIKYYRGAKDMQERTEIFSLLEQYVQISVHTLDSYAQYIRNNNLQSLQTPNYNIETNTGMEKLLIAYSEFLKIFIEFYSKEQRKVDKNNGVGLRREYLPIVVPAPENIDLSVEVLFPDGVTISSEENTKSSEESTESSKKSTKYCMVISVPTLAQLCDIQLTITSLFHEVAHQFRYETRETRNKTILKYDVHHIMRKLAHVLLDQVMKEYGYSSRKWALEKILGDALLKAYRETFAGRSQKTSDTSPLNQYANQLLKEIEINLSYQEPRETYDLQLQEYIQSLSYWYHEEENSTCPGIIDDMTRNFQMFIEGLSERDRKKAEEEDNKKLISGSYEEPTVKEMERLQPPELLRSACQFALECVRQAICAGQPLCTFSVSMVRYIRQIRERPDKNYIFFIKKSEWDHFISNLSMIESDGEKQKIEFGGEAKKILETIWQRYHLFVTQVLEDYQNITKDERENSGVRKDFIKKAYELVCNGWKNRLDERKKWLLQRDSSVEAAGRRLGIDCCTEDNFQSFRQEMETALDHYLPRLKEDHVWCIGTYREETADLIMCNLMNLTAFGYLNLVVNLMYDMALSDESVNRILHVILLSWCQCRDGGEIKYEKFKEMSVEVLSEVNETLKAIWGHEMDSLLEKYEYSFTVPSWEDDQENDQKSSEIEFLGYLNRAKLICDKIIDQTVEKKIKDPEGKKNLKERKDVEEEIRLTGMCKNIISVLSQLIDHAFAQIDYLNEFSELKEDYKTGIDWLSKLRVNMEKDETIADFVQFSGNISRQLNFPDKLLGNDDMRQRSNEKNIEFFLNMYYQNKRRVAIGAEEVCT